MASDDTLNCPWWIRWYHRRLRKIDLVTMGPAILAAVKLSRFTDGEGDQGWEAFKAMQGQEHWRCECYERGRHDAITTFVNDMMAPEDTDAQ